MNVRSCGDVRKYAFVALRYVVPEPMFDQRAGFLTDGEGPLWMMLIETVEGV